MPHLLIIEDDPDLGPLLKLNLEREGYLVTLAATGRRGLELALNGSANLILLDLMLPLMDGMHILQRLRREMFDVPVIILTAKGGEAERLEGFRHGCDDYIAKPFNLMELIARIRAVLRRCGSREIPVVVHSGGITIDPGARTVVLNGTSIALAPREFDLLYVLISHAGQALSRTFLLDDVWGEEVEVTPRTVDNHVASLRKKLDTLRDLHGTIVTVYKLGYMWKSCTE
jgi:DNA-binding response OmpR family regulator